jgi:hypothetical protein
MMDGHAQPTLESQHSQCRAAQRVQRVIELGAVHKGIRQRQVGRHLRTSQPTSSVSLLQKGSWAMSGAQYA